MIFATVGTQLPFPRLLDALESLASRNCLHIVAQTADPGWTGRHIQATPYFSPCEFSAHVARARLLIGHAGIGTILTAKKHRKPLVVLPRRAKLGEHRNDHQLATARALGGVRGCYVAWNVGDLEKLVLEGEFECAQLEASPERDALINTVRIFIERGAE